ncbi:MAG: MBL fold metallo-hydrolase [Sphaerochaeta sp.]|jgi:phosphoribosyl 1,2-cyclic phosphate phosphodiesterase|nr:MBL fold metallo-hydrolase [Sphaerochaeta sp.]MDX9914296.1 MBL fold metallo-hydrolase [Sphaerochaeta sp.]
MSSLTFLGTGTSHGIPVIGCGCDVCTSTDERDRRYRSSVLLRKEGYTLLIDSGPEFRLQAIRSELKSLDGVLYTHDHSDHFNGIDDLRVFCNKRHLPVYTSAQVKSSIEQRFPYVINGTAMGIPHLDVAVLSPYEEGPVGPFSVTAIPIIHGRKTIYGYRIDNTAYLTDCSEVPPESLPYLQNLEVLVVGALRDWPHPNHYSVFEATALGDLLAPERVYFTHLSHHLGHAQLEARLKSGFFVAYDQLTITMKD